MPEVAPLPGEPVIDKATKGAFAQTELDLVLRSRGIRRLVLTGITTDVCVHTTMREGNDLGYECVVLSGLYGGNGPRQSRGGAAHGHHAGRRLWRRGDVRGRARSARAALTVRPRCAHRETCGFSS